MKLMNVIVINRMWSLLLNV